MLRKRKKVIKRVKIGVSLLSRNRKSKWNKLPIIKAESDTIGKSSCKIKRSYNKVNKSVRTIRNWKLVSLPRSMWHLLRKDLEKLILVNTAQNVPLVYMSHKMMTLQQTKQIAKLFLIVLRLLSKTKTVSCEYSKVALELTRIVYTISMNLILINLRSRKNPDPCHWQSISKMMI